VRISNALSMGLVLLAACGGADPLAVNESEGRSITLSVGQELHRTLGTVGPGHFVSPPAISSGSLKFLAMLPPDVMVPAGERQIFSFRAVKAGTVRITYTHTESNRIVEDVITVR